MSITLYTSNDRNLPLPQSQDLASYTGMSSQTRPIPIDQLFDEEVAAAMCMLVEEDAGFLSRQNIRIPGETHDRSLIHELDNGNFETVVYDWKTHEPRVMTLKREEVLDTMRRSGLNVDQALNRDSAFQLEMWPAVLKTALAKLHDPTPADGNYRLGEAEVAKLKPEQLIYELSGRTLDHKQSANLRFPGEFKFKNEAAIWSSLIQANTGAEAVLIRLKLPARKHTSEPLQAQMPADTQRLFAFSGLTSYADGRRLVGLTHPASGQRIQISLDDLVGTGAKMMVFTPDAPHIAEHEQRTQRVIDQMKLNP